MKICINVAQWWLYPVKNFCRRARLLSHQLTLRWVRHRFDARSTDTMTIKAAIFRSATVSTVFAVASAFAAAAPVSAAAP